MGRRRRRPDAQGARTQGVGEAPRDRGRERPDLLDQDEHDDADPDALKDVFNLPPIDVEEIALREAGEAIYQVLLHNEPVELSPQTSYVRRLQHQLAEQHRLQSRSTGLEPNRRVRIFREAEPAGAPA